MKQSTLNNIKQAVNQLIKNNIRLTTEVLSKEAHTSKRTVTEFFKMFPKESFNKYYKNGTAYEIRNCTTAQIESNIKYFTYLMQDSSQLIKIGKSINPFQRLKDLKTGNPSLRIIAVCNDNVEKVLHFKFQNKKYLGEWFNLSPIEVNKLCKEYNFTIL